MSLVKDIIKMDIINNDYLLDRVIKDWNSRYQKTLERLSNKFGLNSQTISTSDSDSEKHNNARNNDKEMAFKLFKKAIKCKAYAETEYRSIKDIRTELEDCQMIKELGISLRKSEEEKSEQNMKLKTLNGKNLELLQEKQNLEKSLLELSLQSKLAIHMSGEKTAQLDCNDKKSALTAKLETYTNRTQAPKRINKNPEYCHIAPNINLFSDSELSVSEEDSLEKDRSHNINPETDYDAHRNNSNNMNQSITDGMHSPDKFGAGIDHVSKSTPMKSHGNTKSNSTDTNSRHSTAISNLTQDLKDIQKYFDKKEDESAVAPEHILDWEMSQISFDDGKDQHHRNGFILEGKEDPDDNQLSPSSELCCGHDKLATVFSSNMVPKANDASQRFNDNMNELQGDLKNERDKYKSLSMLISDLFALVNNQPSELGITDAPTCSGDRPSTDITQDPVEQIRLIRRSIDKGCTKDQVTNKMKEVDDSHNAKHENHSQMVDVTDKCETEDFNASIFKSLSETSVRLLTEIVTKMSQVSHLISENRGQFSPNDTKDYTLLVTEYLQYLMSLDSVDFNNGECRRHPIYDLLTDLETKVRKLVDNHVISGKGNTGISQSLENFYQEQLNKCYDDIDRLKQQLESSQQLLMHKLPLDASQALFEAKQKLQNELESVDREYARQMARERKRLEESENMYNELLNEHEDMQQKYKEKINSLNLQLEQLERKIEVDRKFIDQQQFEWELERAQHNVDIENLNKSLGQIKKSSSCSENLSNFLESPPTERLQKSNSVPKSKYKSLSIESTEISHSETATQTVYRDIIILKTDLSLTDLSGHDEFVDLCERIKRNQTILVNFIHLFSSMIFDLVENNQFQLSIHNIQEFDGKEISEEFDITDAECEDIRMEIVNIRDFFKRFIEDKVNLKAGYDRIQEEFEINVTNASIKQDMIAALEEEIQSLIEFQKNLSKDYDLLQSMLEEKQNELDNLSVKLLSQQAKDDYDENIRVLKKELNEKQNVIDERDEDLYVLKEEKELMEKDLHLLKDKYESLIAQNKDIYQDLEKEMKDTQAINLEFQKRIDDQTSTICEETKEIANLTALQDLLKNQISELNQKNDILNQNIRNLIEENKFASLRLTEINDEHKLEISKLNNSLEEMEIENRKFVEESKANKVVFNTRSCQTESVDNVNVDKESLISFVNIQDKLIKSIDKLRKKYNIERELRLQTEAKYRHFSSQYETLSSKVYLLGNKVCETKADMEPKNNDHNNQSLESVDINDILNESQISIDEDIEFNKLLQECFSIEPNNEYSRAIGTQTESTERISGLKDNINMFSDIGFLSLSDWLPDLLNEVEVVLQSCVIGDDLPSEMVPKMNRFRNLLEQMYKKQLSILLNKISSVEHDIQLQRRINQELKHKSDFVMTELQEKESVIKNLRSQLDQEISNSARFAETSRNLTEQNRFSKSDFTNQISHLRDDLERERNKFTDINRQMRTEQHSREQLEAALSVANERIKLVEQSNVELIKKSRQQADYQQKETDTFNAEFAEMFRRCNNYKIQLEAMQQNLQYQVMESEKTKSELQETIQSNTEYRDKMNEFVKIYQERRKKLETEVNELHQLLQISCRREITFVKENETLRVKCQSVKNICKDYERKMKELENFVSDLHLKHEEDRQDWLNMINGNIDAKDKDDGILSQVNWLLKMLQLRIELLVLHYIPTESRGDSRNEWEIDAQLNSIFKCRPCSADSTINRSNSEMLMLLQSIKSMQSMINLYLHRNQNQVLQSAASAAATVSAGSAGAAAHQSSDKKDIYTNRSEKQSVNQNNIANRPKPTGSSDSLDSISDTDSRSTTDPQESVTCHKEFDSLSTKIYVIQTNKIIELQVSLDHCEKWRQQLIDQKKYILSQLSHKLSSFITTPLLTEEQQIIIHKNFFKFKLKAVVMAVIANIRFIRSIQSSNSSITLGSRLKKAGQQIPQPRFSTNIPFNNKLAIINNRAMSKTSSNINNNINGHGKTQVQSIPRAIKKSQDSPASVVDSRNLKIKAANYETHNGSVNSDSENRIPANRLRVNLSPVASASPVFDRQTSRSVSTNVSSLPRTVNRSATNASSTNLPVHNSYSNTFRKSFPMATKRKNSPNSSDKNALNKSSSTFSTTLKQIDDFGKRLDKYTDVPNGV